MLYLSVEGLTKHYPDNILFENIRFSLNKGDKVGLIANNGAGKSSLLKILMNRDIADEGEVYVRSEIKTSFLEQDPQFDEDESIESLIDGSHTELLSIIREYEDALFQQTNNYSEKTQKAFELASAKMDQNHAWDYERKLKELLSRFNIVDLKKPIRQMSGGEKKRLAMALTLLDDPDLIIMDEPTNHLDIEMIEWLENYLSKSSITILMVTHDRYFLDRVCNRIIELEDGKLFFHKGNYAYFIEKRAEREAVFKSETDKANKLMKKELEWLRRSPKARTTKAKSRIRAFDDIHDKATRKTKKDELKLDVKMSRVGGKILELKNVRKSYGDLKILDGFSHTFKRGERIGIVGRNGVGKSTFLNILLGLEPQDSGKVNVGETTVFGYYAQSGLQLKKDKRVLDILKDIAEVIVLGNGSKLTASEFLNHFLFPPKMQRTYYSRLSGGERRRLYLLTVLIRNPNFLILDEPTNDLDLLTLNKLEEFLESFQGCLVVVTHDRYFMDKLVDQLFVFKGNGEINGYVGTYSEYRSKEAISEKQEKADLKEEKQSKKKQKSERKGLTYKDKLEYQTLEKEIKKLEKEKKELEHFMNSGETDYSILQEKAERLGSVMKLIDDKMFRWMELDEKG
ncbi:MAG: ABC-F family ATP-binding cassette domain-containing protein [Chitinophagales bacterium]|nr:ABC-F family ATP-binding cassette domain-containing protein [Chitinophagales bacterium]